MTRKAARKRRQQTTLQPLHPTTPSSGSPWMTVSTLVASTAITGLLPAFASARDLLPASSTKQSQDQTTAPVSTTYRFEIPAGPFADVLAAFERVTGVHVTLSIESIGAVQSPGA